MSLFKKAEPKNVEILGESLICPICKNDTFYNREAQLNTSMATLFNLDWANKSATCFVCSKCTHISWFLGEE